MRALYYECFSGISGDMHIGALVDLGVPADYLNAQLARLNVANEFELRLERASKHGISGTQATVVLAPDAERPHRHLRHVKAIIESAQLAPKVTAQALNIFQHIAEAEAKIHDIAIEKVHFHEVGATDSIVDIVAAAIGLDYLQVDHIYCGEVEVGGGTVRCDHGLMPVPAPATAAILQGVPCHYGRVDSEATTPTGAAILKSAVNEFTVPKHFTSTQQGYGVGHKDFSIPNILRMSLGEVATATDNQSLQFYQQETNLEVECNIDDMPGEAFQPLLDALFATPVIDAYVTPIQMKKQRPAHKLSVLCNETQLPVVLECIFSHSTTLGVRTKAVQKWMLPREQQSITTSMGLVQVKIARTINGEVRWKIEHDDILALSQGASNYLTVATKLRIEVEQILNNSSAAQ
jgi:uncharacterized protein (TIGR00299 family) protein